MVLIGAFDEAFLDIPPEVIRTTIRTNQKCFVLQTASDALGGATERQASSPTAFILVANIEASDGGKAIVAGNERVIRARLSDARYFWETDLKTKLEATALPKLEAQNIVFHEKLGTQGERVERIARLAREIAPLVGADPDKAERAAKLAKADLVTEMVGEFPELQGLMGSTTRSRRARTPSVADRHRGSLQAASAPPTACRPTRSPSPSRSPTSSTRWSASGRSTRSRPAARTRTRCGGRRWG